jgi:hypothetical protein
VLTLAFVLGALGVLGVLWSLVLGASFIINRSLGAHAFAALGTGILLLVGGVASVLGFLLFRGGTKLRAP